MLLQVLSIRTFSSLKGLCHALLGNVGTCQLFIELTEISQRLRTVEELKRNTKRPKGAMYGQDSRGLKQIALG